MKTGDGVEIVDKFELGRRRNHERCGGGATWLNIPRQTEKETKSRGIRVDEGFVKQVAASSAWFLLAPSSFQDKSPTSPY